MVLALGQIISLLLSLRHLLCLDLLLVDPRLLLWHCYWKLLLRSCMMHMDG
jgi:hypothetical protein